MEEQKSLKYLRAKKKVETLKGFYGHLTAYILVNAFLILLQAGMFKGRLSFGDWEIYATAVFWGIGLLAHALYVFVYFFFRNNRIKKWEERKIQEILDKDE